MATIADLELRLADMAAKIAALEARPLPDDVAAAIKALEERVAALEADGNRLRFDEAGELGPDDQPQPEQFKNVGDWLTDKLGRWWRRTETGVELWREDWVVEPPE